MTKKALILMAICSLVIFNCSKKTTTNNYYATPGEGGAIVGVVSPADSKAKVSVSIAIEMASTNIDTSGYFKLSGLPAGTYSLLVQADEYYGCKFKVNVADGATVLLDTIFLKSIHDLIGSVSPPDGAEGVGLSGKIWIWFRREMDKESVEKAFHIEPMVEGTFSWYARFIWEEEPSPGSTMSSSSTSLNFSPKDGFAANTCYQVTIDTSASDTAGIKLTEPYQFSFTTEPIRIEFTSPEDNETGVSLMTKILIYFNTYMDVESVNSAFQMVDSGLNEVTGEFSWPSPSRMEFHPSLALTFGETYTVTIDTSARDAQGSRLSEPYQFSFTTESVRVVYTSPGHNQTGISPYTKVLINFNTDMDMESVISAFKMVDSNLKEVMGNFVWSSWCNMEFQPNSLLAVNETYTVTIDTTASSTEGKRLSQAYQFSFTTRPLLVMSTKPRHKDTWVSPYSDVEITFSIDMDIESVNSAFKMVDSGFKEVTGNFVWSNRWRVEFQPNSPMAVDETYTVTIDTTASAFEGTKLPKPYQFSFTTEPLRIVSARPRHGETWVSPYTRVGITFNTDVDTTSVVSAFKMADSQLKQVKGKFLWPYLRYMDFRPDSVLAFGETYTVTIGTDVKDMHGKTLNQPYTFWFKIRSE